MPTYTYQCKNSHQLDVTHSMYAGATINCPECREPMEKKLSAPTITFKGSGFYSTDK